MERYNLNWTPSVDQRAVKQTVMAKANGGDPTEVAQIADNQTATQKVIFPTDAAVEWWVVASNSDGSELGESAHRNFTANNQTAPTALAPPTGLNESWDAHIDDAPPAA